ncbi:MAG: hypothetical protein P4L96_16310 [Rhodoferax sp.]|nr:hypothetical protein [Rhodoferax sp.]
MNFKTPRLNALFTISPTPEWPSVLFETDASGAHTWFWTVTWGTFSRSGQSTTPANQWDAKPAITNLGGTLTVRAQAGTDTATITVKIQGTNPVAADVIQYLASTPSSAGFDKILAQESKFRHFNAGNEPVKSFDNGFGMCQLTTPPPSFEQVWNWKLNVDGGLALFGKKRSGAIAYLSQSGRSYTDDQLKYETVCRWNGGSYHVWDANAGAWKRKPNILCDSKSGNIGWDMTDAQNKGKTEAALHNRDSGKYAKGPAAGAHWMYSGVCYADHVLG